MAQPISGHATFDYTEQDVENYVVDPEVSRTIVRKYDQRVLPMVFCMYLFSALDRGNLANVKTNTLEKDLVLPFRYLSPSVLTAMTVMLSTCAVVGGFLTRRFGPIRMLPIYKLSWASMALINAAARNSGGIVTMRFFLAWVFQANVALAGWMILFIIEGGMTVVVALISMWILPHYPQRAAFLSALEKEVADALKRVNTPFNYTEFFAPLREWKFYVLAVLAVVHLFLDSSSNIRIIGRFNLGEVKTNLYTVAPYCAATLYMWANAWASDRVRQRSPFLIGALSLTTIECIILAALPVTAIGSGYFACFLITMGAFGPLSLFHSWHNNNDPSENGRAFRTGSLTFATNSGGFVSANIFLNSDAPKYTHAVIVSASLQVAGIAIAPGLRGYISLDNRRRNRKQGVNWVRLFSPFY
ncbi:major facilitator superfamily domain-containing protein [Mycena galericulata]|nr:major facilitator superfamily domain-containing protein [Mycena galericulata]